MGEFLRFILDLHQFSTENVCFPFSFFKNLLQIVTRVFILHVHGIRRNEERSIWPSSKWNKILNDDDLEPESGNRQPSTSVATNHKTGLEKSIAGDVTY